MQEHEGHSIYQHFEMRILKNCISGLSYEYHTSDKDNWSAKMQIVTPESTTAFVPSRHFSFSGFYTGISQSTPVVSFQNLLIDFHESVGLPWWGIILLTTLGIRTAVVFPLAVHQHQVIARLANINVEIGKLVPQLNKEVNMAKVMYKWDETQAKKVFKKQVAANLTFTSLHSNPVPEPLIGLKTEGLLWFSDLTTPDMIAIPLLLLFVNLTLTEVSALRSVGKGSKLQKILLNTSRLIIFVVAAVATVNPSSVSFYWLCSSTFGLGQNFLLMSPKVLEVSEDTTDPKRKFNAFFDIAANFRRKFYKL
ncbi:cytochrome c oxidase assembly protein COX18, mitochondrial [Caerostris extrusa]|uniref:Cytochrome c oxidase assembly protein COX18, mitochondrial n=1 Tax=Caerostris extrusa TaxID=172846 RepID=A0AAV4MAU4_CAEEX|nr:cytochrome c oxidase assembly protein COX18, mitochondrial [Caerostris extrusa]